MDIEVNATNEGIVVDDWSDHSRILFGNLQVNLTDTQLEQLRAEIDEYLDNAK
jgi:hypothetical protein